MIRVCGAPFDGGGAKLGSRLGPSAVRLAGLEDNLKALGWPVDVWTDLPLPDPEESYDGLRSFNGFLTTAKAVKLFVGQTLADGHFPLVIGGEHSLSAGSVAGAVAGAPHEKWAVLWIDAHADLNSPGTSESGNLHGMPLAALCRQRAGVQGLAADQWNELLRITSPGLSLGQIGWLGLRDVDLGERRTLASSPQSPAITMFDIDHEGIEAQVTKLDHWLQEGETTRLWVSFDVDVMDPILAPGTGTAVRGGLTYREAHLLAELLHRLLTKTERVCRLGGLDVVEVNPLEDIHNQTAKMAVEWTASLFGKTILGLPLIPGLPHGN